MATLSPTSRAARMKAVTLSVGLAAEEKEEEGAARTGAADGRDANARESTAARVARFQHRKAVTLSVGMASAEAEEEDEAAGKTGAGEKGPAFKRRLRRAATVGGWDKPSEDQLRSQAGVVFQEIRDLAWEATLGKLAAWLSPAHLFDPPADVLDLPPKLRSCMMWYFRMLKTHREAIAFLARTFKPWEEIVVAMTRGSASKLEGEAAASIASQNARSAGSPASARSPTSRAAAAAKAEAAAGAATTTAGAEVGSGAGARLPGASPEPSGAPAGARAGGGTGLGPAGDDGKLASEIGKAQVEAEHEEEEGENDGEWYQDGEEEDPKERKAFGAIALSWMVRSQSTSAGLKDRLKNLEHRTRVLEHRAEQALQDSIQLKPAPSAQQFSSIDLFCKMKRPLKDGKLGMAEVEGEQDPHLKPAEAGESFESFASSREEKEEEKDAMATTTSLAQVRSLVDGAVRRARAAIAAEVAEALQVAQEEVTADVAKLRQMVNMMHDSLQSRDGDLRESVELCHRQIETLFGRLADRKLEENVLELRKQVARHGRKLGDEEDGSDGELFKRQVSREAGSELAQALQDMGEAVSGLSERIEKVEVTSLTPAQFRAILQQVQHLSDIEIRWQRLAARAETATRSAEEHLKRLSAEEDGQPLLNATVADAATKLLPISAKAVTRPLVNANFAVGRPVPSSSRPSTARSERTMNFSLPVTPRGGHRAAAAAGRRPSTATVRTAPSAALRHTTTKTSMASASAETSPDASPQAGAQRHSTL